MIVGNFHLGRSVVACRPFKANAPLAIDADTELALSVPSENLQVVTAQCSQVLKRFGGIQGFESFLIQLGKSLKGRNAFSLSKALGPAVSVASDHA
jgi:hypothetical protein